MNEIEQILRLLRIASNWARRTGKAHALVVRRNGDIDVVPVSVAAAYKKTFRILEIVHG